MFYSLEADTSGSSKAARFSRVYASKKIASECDHCRAQTFEPSGDISMDVISERGAFWPDAAQCFGAFHGFYVSQNVTEHFAAEGIRYGKAFPAKVQGRVPKKLESISPPNYSYITGEMGAKFDFTYAGMKVDSSCPACGRVTRKAQEVGRHNFIEGSWNGSDIFYTDLSPCSYYCTERVVALARSHQWTNFRFLPLEEAHDVAHRGIDYLSA